MGNGGAVSLGVLASVLAPASGALARQAVQTDVLRLTSDHGGFAVVGKTETGDGKTTVQTKTTFETRVEAFTGKVEFTVDTGRSAVDTSLVALDQRSWRTERLDVATSLTPLSALKFDLTAAHQEREDVRVDPLASPEAREADVRATERQAGLTARLALARNLALNLSGQARESLTEEASAGQVAVLDSDQAALTASVSWKVHPKLSLDARSSVREQVVSWRSEGSGAVRREDQFQYQEPRVAAVLSIWDGGRLEIETGRAIEPLNNGDFISLARAAGQTEAARLEPAREWRTRARFSKRLFDKLQLDAGYAIAELESVTELSALGAPASVDEGQRNQADIKLSLPFQGPDLSSMALTSRGVWRDSEVRDPLTGELRRRSGEPPFEASLGLTQELRGGRLRWGVDGGWTGRQAYYGVDRMNVSEGFARWGAYVERRHDDLVLRLQVENAGAGRDYREIIYDGPRGSGDAIAVNHGENAAGQAIRLSVRRAL